MSETNERIIQVNIEEQMKSAYIDYSMSVIVSRALPDVRDGLKPVQRRVLFGMNEIGIHYNKSHRKSARIVGDVLGKFHPHGDSSVYLAMVRMAQPWSLRYNLVDGQGNFGSMDDDGPAAMRYTEARLTKISDFLLSDIDKNTVDFQPNFDETLQEPTVLPTRIPNLLINGTSGIAVGMATNMPPHNLTDTIDTIIAYIDNNNIEDDDLIKIIKAPDFPTGGTIYGYQGVINAYKTGKGKIVIRAKHSFEETASGKPKIVFTEIPYMVNKANEISKIGDLANNGKIEGIVYANDESDRNGIRVVITLSRDANPNVVLNKIFKYTQFQSSFNVNNIALVKGRPQLLTLRDLISNFVEHRMDVIIRRTRFELDKAEKDAHILEGFLIALDHLDEIISLIRNSKDPEEAKTGLISNFNLSELQAAAILKMQLQRLTGMERDKIKNNYEELMKLITYLKEVLTDENLRFKIIKEELEEVKEKFGDKRRTEIVLEAQEFNPEDFYADEDVVITISNLGYIKRTPLSEYKSQNRGGKGFKGVSTRDQDFVRYLYIASNHNTLLLFSDKGKCYSLKVYELPEGAKNTKGRHIQNILRVDADEKIIGYLNVTNLDNEEYINSHYIVMATKRGLVKKTLLSKYSNVRSNGIIAFKKNENDQLLTVKLTNGENFIIISTNNGKTVKFHESLVRATGRNSMGVKGITLSGDDRVIGMVCTESQDEHLMVVSENGIGKRSIISDYRTTNRGTKGVKTMKVNEKTGKVVAIKDVTDDDDLMIITKKGLTIRLVVANLRVMARATQGVKLINFGKNDAIASVAKIKDGAIQRQQEEIDAQVHNENEDFENEENNQELKDDTNTNTLENNDLEDKE